VGKGTAVTLYLPCSVTAVRETLVEQEEPICGTGTVLLVDDDPEVRSVTAQLLEMSGYTVIAASNSPEAIACFQRHGREIDVLVTDLVLANGLNGLDLMSALLAERPTLPVLLITGYSEALANSPHAGSAPVLVKPFDHSTLARAIQSAIRTAGHNVSRHARVEAL
jgi:DNA-binding NtrC family response regulator